MKKENWVWMPHAGHLIVARDCRFHLNTYVGGYLVSTVGEYLPDSQVREILATSRGVALEGMGDAREADFIRKLGYERIGCDRTYETMVFTAKRANGKDRPCCPYEAAKYDSVDFQAYNEPEAAFAGHMKLCAKWSKKAKTEHGSARSTVLTTMNKRNSRPIADRFWEKVNRYTGPYILNTRCWIWTASSGERRYGQLWFKGTNVKAHRIAWLLKHGALPPKGRVVMHRCDNTRCVRADHLSIGTPRENSQDAQSKGRLSDRARPYRLTETQIEEVRQRVKAGEKRHLIAESLGVSIRTVQNIGNGHTYKIRA